MKKSLTGIFIILILIGILLYLRRRAINKLNTEGQNIGRPDPATALIDEDYCLKSWCCPDSTNNIWSWKMYACGNCQGLIGTYAIEDFEKEVYKAHGVKRTC